VRVLIFNLQGLSVYGAVALKPPVTAHVLCIRVFSTCYRGHAVAYWLRHHATNRKVAGSIPDEVIF
jgi:hypothetical protein